MLSQLVDTLVAIIKGSWWPHPNHWQPGWCQPYDGLEHWTTADDPANCGHHRVGRFWINKLWTLKGLQILIKTNCGHHRVCRFLVNKLWTSKGLQILNKTNCGHHRVCRFLKNCWHHRVCRFLKKQTVDKKTIFNSEPSHSSPWRTNIVWFESAHCVVWHPFNF